MSAYDRFRALPQRFIDRGLLVPVTLQRPNGEFRPKELGRVVATGTHIGHGALTVRRTTSANGELVSTTIAKLTVEPKIGDTLLIGTNDPLEVMSVTEIAPDGLTPIMFEAVVR